MMWCSILGIILVFIGTAFSLWTIITNDTKRAGTWLAMKEAGKDAKKEKKYVLAGIVLIFVGSVLQIVGCCNG